MKKIKYSRLFILGVLIYILFKGLSILIGMNTSVLALKNDNYTMKIKTKALIIRDEYLIKSDTKGSLSLMVNENEKVHKSQKIATIYNEHINNEINKEIYDLKEDIKSIEKNNSSFQQGILFMKKEQLKILEEKIRNNSTDYYSKISGVVSYKYDNNEEKYSSENLSTLTKDDIQKTTNNYLYANKDNTKIKEGDVIARIIDNNQAYMAFVIKDNKLFKQGDSVKIEIKEELVNGEIYQIFKKRNYFIAVVKITQQNIRIYDTRQEEFDIIYKQMEALRIPKQSLVNENNKKGLYVINEENNKPKFVEIKGHYFEDENYIYVDFRKNQIEGIKTVNLHDRIILKPNFINTKISKIN